MGTRFFVVAAMLASAIGVGCSGSGSDGTDSRSAASNISASGTTTGSGVFPIVVVLDEELQAAAQAADAQSKALDQRCAHLPMAAELHSKRPGGTGCPRPEPIAEAIIEVLP